MSVLPEPLASPDTPSRRGTTGGPPRRFEFERDSFAFANELLWEYRFDPATGKTAFSRREPIPVYAHRCFVLARAARQFFYHARFDPALSRSDAAAYRSLIREVLSRDPRTSCEPGRQIIIPGYASLREFSQTQEHLLKSQCGAAWRSYVLRSHWRMVFPISRQHQARTAVKLAEGIRRGNPPIIHLVRFPKLTINHGMVLLAATALPDGVRFQAYDPNDPKKPAELSFDGAAQTFRLPANRYWAGGPLNVIEIYRGWWL